MPFPCSTDNFLAQDILRHFHWTTPHYNTTFLHLLSHFSLVSSLCEMSPSETAGAAPPRHLSVGCSSETAVTTDVGSVCFSDSDRSWQSAVGSASGESSGIEGVSCPHSHREPWSASDCEADLESGELERKVHFGNEERNCRICHLNLVAAVGDGGAAMELGCDCKGDLGAAHKQCAETWFKIKGDTTCEICGSTARNIAGDQINEADVHASTAPAASTNEARLGFPEVHTTYNWQGRRIINMLFGCMVLAFVISWLLHFKVLPS